MRRVMMAALLAAVSAPSSAEADQPGIASGNGLYEACTGTGILRGYCTGYISGVGDTLGGGAFGAVYCPPANVTYEQAVDIVTAGLTNHPEERQLHSVILIIKYLKAAWPCPTKTK